MDDQSQIIVFLGYGLDPKNQLIKLLPLYLRGLFPELKTSSPGYHYKK